MAEHFLEQDSLKNLALTCKYFFEHVGPVCEKQFYADKLECYAADYSTWGSALTWAIRVPGCIYKGHIPDKISDLDIRAVRRQPCTWVMRCFAVNYAAQFAPSLLSRIVSEREQSTESNYQRIKP